jgi:hypothetical protein
VSSAAGITTRSQRLNLAQRSNADEPELVSFIAISLVAGAIQMPEADLCGIVVSD